jgi:hypothetical protein
MEGGGGGEYEDEDEEGDDFRFVTLFLLSLLNKGN